MEKRKTCPKCRGLKRIATHSKHATTYRECSTCHGRGYLVADRQDIPLESRRGMRPGR